MHTVRRILTNNNKKKKKSEFSQQLVIVSWAVTIIWISLSFVLAFLGRDTNSEVTVALVTESFGVTVAYYAYQAILKTSRNKYGIDHNGIPFKISQKLGNIMGYNAGQGYDTYNQGYNTFDNDQEGVG